MQKTHALLILCFVLLSNSGLSGQAEYDDCILKHLKNAKLDAATQLIKQACDENYKNPSFTTEKKRAYNNCLMENLTGVESIEAVIDINAACSNKHK